MIFKPTLLAAASALALLAASQAHAVSISGNTTGAPTYNRTLTGAPPAGLSAVGTAVPYVASRFTVGTAGSYQFLSIALGGWDNFTSLYQTTFVPTAALTNVLVSNDDYLDDVNNMGVSGFSATLAAGTTYIFVTTGFGNASFGAFTDSITGPGTVTLSPVPETATYVSMALGLAGLAFVRRRALAARS